MGKKRRLKAAKAKFRSKHSSHPRMRLLMKKAETEVVEEETKIVEATPTPVVTTPEVKATPKIVETPTTTKVTTPKLTKTKKTAPTPRKKTTTTKKRTTKKKTTSATA